MAREDGMDQKTVWRRAPAPRRRVSWAEEQSAAFFKVAGILVGWFFRFWIRRYRVIGAGNVPAEGGAFVIANHRSAMDPFLLAYPIRRRRPLGPGKIELFANPIVAYVMHKIGIFPIRQNTADPGAVRAMVDGYRHGRPVLVYPEGGRSETGELRPFFPDFARLAIKLRAPLIPAGIAGAADALPIGSLMPRFNVPVVVAFGTPFDLSAYSGRPMSPELAQEAAEYMRTRVAELLEQAEAKRRRLEQGTAR